MRIFKWDRFNDIIENRVKKIDMNTFETLLENCYKYNSNVLYKKIYNPNFEIGIFNKSLKINEYVNDEPLNIDSSFPSKNTSLVCTTEHVLEDDDTTLFVVLPYRESLFTIKNKNDYYKGYWKDKIQWVEKFNENKLWTESNCLLIRKDIWDSFSINEDLENYSDRDSFEIKFKKTFKQVCRTWKKTELQKKYFDEKYGGLRELKKKRDELIHPKKVEHLHGASNTEFEKLKTVFNDYDSFINSLMKDFFITVTLPNTYFGT